jgi:hypothetical protein
MHPIRQSFQIVLSATAVLQDVLNFLRTYKLEPTVMAHGNHAVHVLTQKFGQNQRTKCSVDRGDEKRAARLETLL